jgi:hypothetical protein
MRERLLIKLGSKRRQRQDYAACDTRDGLPRQEVAARNQEAVLLRPAYLRQEPLTGRPSFQALGSTAIVSTSEAPGDATAETHHAAKHRRRNSLWSCLMSRVFEYGPVPSPAVTDASLSDLPTKLIAACRESSSSLETQRAFHRCTRLRQARESGGDAGGTGSKP